LHDSEASTCDQGESSDARTSVLAGHAAMIQSSFVSRANGQQKHQELPPTMAKPLKQEPIKKEVPAFQVQPPMHELGLVETLSERPHKSSHSKVATAQLGAETKAGRGEKEHEHKHESRIDANSLKKGGGKSEGAAKGKKTQHPVEAEQTFWMQSFLFALTVVAPILLLVCGSPLGKTAEYQTQNQLMGTETEAEKSGYIGVVESN